MTRPVCDLHMHSNCSDGALEPAELIKYAAESDAEELSLTDHDTFVGIEEAQEAAKSLGISFMNGMELTCDFGDRKIHILGYGYPLAAAKNDSELSKHLMQVREADCNWALEMCRKSYDDPLLVTTADGKEHQIVVKESEMDWIRGTMISAFHMGVVISKKLQELDKNLVISPRHCLYLFFGRPEPDRKHESWWPPVKELHKSTLEKYKIDARAYWWVARPEGEFFSVENAVAAFKRIGAIPVLAHPRASEGGKSMEHAEIKQIADMGIKGIETYTFKHTRDDIKMLREIADELGLFVTSGTDFHDPNHRAQVKPGRNRAGEYLTKGASLKDFEVMGACIYEALL